MRLNLTTALLAALLAAHLGCEDPAASSANHAASDADTSATSQAISDTTAADAAAHDAAQQQVLSLRLTALDFFTERMWPGHDGEAGLNWLRTSAAGSGLELTTVMPEALITRDGVAIRPVTLQAQGEWAAVVSWLQAIEASPRRLVLRGVELHTLRNRVVADLKLAMLIDRPTGLEELAAMDVAELRGDDLHRAIRLIEAELRGKSQTLNQLGADASWSRPIAELTAGLPPSSRPVNLSLVRTGNDGRAREFAGTFTLMVPDAGLVPEYVRRLQKQPGFAAAGLQSLRPAGAEWQRAAVTFSYTGDAKTSGGGASDLAEASAE